MNILDILQFDNAQMFFSAGFLAYIDPGTGSIILQAIIGTVVGVGIAVKLFWHRILKFIGIRKTDQTDGDSLAAKDK